MDNDEADEIDIDDFENPRSMAYYQLSKAFAKCPSLRFIAENIKNLAQVEITCGIPILPMLAKPTSSIDEIFDKTN